MPGSGMLNLPTSEIRVDDVVHCHGMRVRIDRIRPYHPHSTGCVSGPGAATLTQCDLAWACYGTVLNVREAIEVHGIPRSFLFDAERDSHGPGRGREDFWNVQGNNLATWRVQRPRPYWTIAYRKPTGPVFHRVTDWSGTWRQAHDLAGEFARAHPGLQVWYTTTRQAELDGYVTTEDTGNILTDTGHRVQVADNGTIALP